MKALFVWDSDYPWDIRVEKICNTLINNGWEVHLVCRNRSRKPTEELYQGIHLHRLPCVPKRFGFLNDIVTFPAFFSPLWLARVSKVARQQNVDLIIVRDLPIALTAIIISKIQKIPVILDMAECYPEFVRLMWKFEPFKVFNIFIRNPRIVDLVERLSTKNTDHIFVMVEESKNRLFQKGISADKITIVSNTPALKRFQEATPTYPGLLKQHKEKLIMLYVGLLNFSRGVDTVLQSLRDYIEINRKVFLILLGTGNAEQYLRKMTNKLKLGDYIGFEGWVDNKIVPEYIASSDICLVPHYKCGHWDNTIPNKLFDYMAAGKPVLVSDVNPMKRIVQQANCGLVHKDRDTNSFVAQLLKLQDRNLRRKLGLNGLNAVQEYYNWDKDSARMLKNIGRVIEKNG